jgi:hypothetical protein
MDLDGDREMELTGQERIGQDPQAEFSAASEADARCSSPAATR